MPESVAGWVCSITGSSIGVGLGWGDGDATTKDGVCPSSKKALLCISSIFAVSRAGLNGASISAGRLGAGFEVRVLYALKNIQAIVVIIVRIPILI